MGTFRKLLHWGDFIVLSIIFFGYATYNAVMQYFSNIQEDTNINDNSFSEGDNWWGIATEVIILFIATLYLLWRKFDFSALDFSVNRYTLPLAGVLVILGGLVSDVVLYGHYWLSTGYLPYLSFSFANDFLGHITWSLILFSLLNGFYEEIFFMGLAFAVKPQYQRNVLIMSLFVRFIFHIYQGIFTALAITLVGLLFIFFRKKGISLIPFILAHSVFDVWGAGILSWLM